MKIFIVLFALCLVAQASLRLETKKEHDNKCGWFTDGVSMWMNQIREQVQRFDINGVIENLKLIPEILEETAHCTFDMNVTRCYNDVETAYQRVQTLYEHLLAHDHNKIIEDSIALIDLLKTGEIDCLNEDSLTRFTDSVQVHDVNKCVNDVTKSIPTIEDVVTQITSKKPDLTKIMTDIATLYTDYTSIESDCRLELKDEESVTTRLLQESYYWNDDNCTLPINSLKKSLHEEFKFLNNGTFPVNEFMHAYFKVQADFTTVVFYCGIERAFDTVIDVFANEQEFKEPRKCVNMFKGSYPLFKTIKQNMDRKNYSGIFFSIGETIQYFERGIWDCQTDKTWPPQVWVFGSGDCNKDIDGLVDSYYELITIQQRMTPDFVTNYEMIMETYAHIYINYLNIFKSNDCKDPEAAIDRLIEDIFAKLPYDEELLMSCKYDILGLVPWAKRMVGSIKTGRKSRMVSAFAAGVDLIQGIKEDCNIKDQLQIIDLMSFSSVRNTENETCKDSIKTMITDVYKVDQLLMDRDYSKTDLQLYVLEFYQQLDIAAKTCKNPETTYNYVVDDYLERMPMPYGVNRTECGVDLKELYPKLVETGYYFKAGNTDKFLLALSALLSKSVSTKQTCTGKSGYDLMMLEDESYITVGNCNQDVRNAITTFKQMSLATDKTMQFMYIMELAEDFKKAQDVCKTQKDYDQAVDDIWPFITLPQTANKEKCKNDAKALYPIIDSIVEDLKSGKSDNIITDVLVAANFVMHSKKDCGVEE